MSSSPPLVSIITVNYNSANETTAFVESLLLADYTHWELFIVDNGSVSFDGAAFRSMDPRITVIESAVNLGFAGGNNLALEHCSGAYLFYVNNDTILEADTISQLVRTAVSTKNLGGVSPKVLYFHSPGVIEYAGCTQVNMLTGRNRSIGYGEKDDNAHSSLISTSYLHGCAMLLPTEIIRQVGPMDEDFFLYYEELDWCERIRRCGRNIFCEQRARIHHKESASVGRVSPLKVFYMTRSRLLFMWRNFSLIELMPFTVFFVLVSLPKNSFLFLVKGQWRHFTAFIRGIKGVFNPLARY